MEDETQPDSVMGEFEGAGSPVNCPAGEDETVQEGFESELSGSQQPQNLFIFKIIITVPTTPSFLPSTYPSIAVRLPGVCLCVHLSLNGWMDGRFRFSR